MTAMSWSYELYWSDRKHEVYIFYNFITSHEFSYMNRRFCNIIMKNREQFSETCFCYKDIVFNTVYFKKNSILLSWIVELLSWTPPGHLVLSHMGFANVLLLRPLTLNHTLDQFMAFPDLTFYRLWRYKWIQVSIGHLQRVWHADGGRLLLRTPGPVPLGLAYVLLVETNPFTNLSLFYRTMLFEYPSVLSRFCLDKPF